MKNNDIMALANEKMSSIGFKPNRPLTLKLLEGLKYRLEKAERNKVSY